MCQVVGVKKYDDKISVLELLTDITIKKWLKNNNVFLIHFLQL